MKLSLSLVLLAAFFFSACEDEPPVRSTRRHPSRYPAAPPPTEYPPQPQPYENGPTPPPSDYVEAPTQPAATAPPKQPKGDIPYGIPVPNKPGFVTSPYAPNQGYVDVRGFPPGTEVKDPYTQQNLSRPLNRSWFCGALGMAARALWCGRSAAALDKAADSPDADRRARPPW